MPNATKSTCVLEAMKHIKLSSAGYFISDKYIDDTNMHKDCHYKMEHMIFNGNTPK